MHHFYSSVGFGLNVWLTLNSILAARMASFMTICIHQRHIMSLPFTVHPHTSSFCPPAFCLWPSGIWFCWAKLKRHVSLWYWTNTSFISNFPLLCENSCCSCLLSYPAFPSLLSRSHLFRLPHSWIQLRAKSLLSCRGGILLYLWVMERAERANGLKMLLGWKLWRKWGAAGEETELHAPNERPSILFGRAH